MIQGGPRPSPDAPAYPYSYSLFPGSLNGLRPSRIPRAYHISCPNCHRAAPLIPLLGSHRRPLRTDQKTSSSLAFGPGCGEPVQDLGWAPLTSRSQKRPPLSLDPAALLRPLVASYNRLALREEGWLLDLPLWIDHHLLVLSGKSLLDTWNCKE